MYQNSLTQRLKHIDMRRKKTGKTKAEEYDGIRETAAARVNDCIQYALMKNPNTAGREKEIGEAMDIQAKRFADIQRVMGVAMAAKDLKQRSETIAQLGEYRVLPADGPINKQKDRDRLNAQRAAADLTIRLYAIAIRLVMGADFEGLERIINTAMFLYPQGILELVRELDKAEQADT